MQDWIMAVLWIAIIGGIVGHEIGKTITNRKGLESGEDKASVRSAAQPVLGDGDILYAHWEKSEYYGRTTKTTYYRYVLTYRDDILIVAPLGIDKKTREIQVGQTAVFSPANLGKVEVNNTLKDGAVSHMGICLRDKQGETMFQFDVDAKNTRKNKWFPVNIAQQGECEKFERFITGLSQQVAAENPGIEDIIKANNNSAMGIIGAGLAILGAVLGFFFAPVGVVLALIGGGLALASKLKGTAGKRNGPLIISAICLVLSLGSLVMFLTSY